MNIKDLINTPRELFDLEAEYDQHLAPLVDQLMAKAEELGIPTIFAAAWKQDAEGVGIVSAAQSLDPGKTPLLLRAGFHLARQEPEKGVELMMADKRRVERQVH